MRHSRTDIPTQDIQAHGNLKGHVIPRENKFGYEHIMHSLIRMAKAPGGVAAMDRQAALSWVGLELKADRELLLQRGFDRAYRQIVEGV